MNSRIAVLLLALFVATDAFSLDTEIRVLGVITADAVNDDNISAQLKQIEAVWNGSGITTVTTMVLANANNASGNPIKPTLVGPPLVTTHYASTYIQVTSGAYNLAALRNQYQADLVVVFVPGSSMSNVCGFAPQDNWTKANGVPGVYLPKPSTFFLDLSGAESFYVALASTSAACTQIQPNNNQQNNAIHEIGHLFGAGHDLEQPPVTNPPLPGPDPVDFYLFDDSHAFVSVFSFFGSNLGIKSAMSRQDFMIAKCVNTAAGVCFATPLFSRDGGFGDGAHDNAKTLAFTALSVANYRPVPSGCGLSKPTDVLGGVIIACYPRTNLTLHLVTWEDSCPEATDYYEVHRSLTSAFGPYSFGWTTQTMSTTIFNNIDGWVKIKACNTSQGCTGRSDSLYYAPALCAF